MTDWPVRALGEVCDFVSGSVTPKPGVKYEVFSVPSFDCGNPELLDGSEIKSSKRPVESGDVLLCKINPRINRVWRVDRESKNQQIASTEWIALRCRGNVLDVFLQYVLQAPSARTAMIESVTGATGSHTRAKYEIVEELEFSVPPLEEQKRIVALLDAATARVTELTACYEQARTHANNLFTSALRAALESNPDWPVKVIGDVCELSLGKMLDSKQRTGLHPTLYLRNVNVRWGLIDTRDMSSMDIRPEEMDRVTASPGDVIVCEGGEPGRCAVWRGPGRIAIQKALHRVRPKNEIDADYVALFLVFLAETGELKYFFTGTTIKHLPKEKLHLVPIPVPPLEEQKWIVARLNSMRAKTSEVTAAYDAKLTAAKNLRQSILEAAFAGDL